MDEPVWFIEPTKWPVWDGPTNAILCYTSTEEGVDMNNQAGDQVTADIKTKSIQ